MTDTFQTCVFYGVGSRYVYESIEMARRSGIRIQAFIDNRAESHQQPITGLPSHPVSITEAAKNKLFEYSLHIPLITPGYRKKLVHELSAYGQVRYLDLVDPTAVVAESSHHEEGFSVNAGVVIGANCHFGKHVLVNRSVSIGHDAYVEDYVTFGPACVLCGSCKLGAGVFVGAGAVICPEVSIGRNAVIGAGAIVARDVPEGAIVVGNPAKMIKENQPGYNGVGV